jgi:hypothetical protein
VFEAVAAAGAAQAAAGQAGGEDHAVEFLSDVKPVRRLVLS